LDMLEKFLQNSRLQDPEDMDSLLEFASLMRQLIESKRYPDISRVIRYVVARSYHEAFVWAMELLQEEFERADSEAEDFECPLGRSIPDFNEFVGRLNVDSDASRNDIEKVHDENGEVQSFFNILTYKTGFANIRLVSAENFDTKDNDYIQYKLQFFKS